MMARAEGATLAIVVIAALALIGVALASASFATRQSMPRMMGGMGMGTTSTDTGPGGFEWAILIASIVFFLGAVVLMLRPRAPAVARIAPDVVRSVAPASPPAPSPSGNPEPISELTLVKLLDGDERRMYLEIRDRGGEALQRDLVAQGTFSKAKVTRVLDKLEGKGLVIRERHGMTNRVRLVRTGVAR